MEAKDLQRIDNFYKNESIADEKFVTESFSTPSNEEQLQKLSQRHWANVSAEKTDLRHVLRKIHHRIYPVPAEKKNPFQHLLPIYSRVAAILLIPALLAGVYFSLSYFSAENPYAEISAPTGSRVHFSLPDGSKGYLNGGSVLSYHVNFKDDRKLNLSGEAYFEVTKDRFHPFTVHTNFADVQVLGTKFDICAYPEDENMLTTLEEGQVRILNKSDQRTALLVPGQQNRIKYANGSMQTTQVNTRLYTSWKEEILRFDNTPFAEVVKQMERWYGVNILLDPSLQYSQNYTLTIKTESLREMLQLLTITTPFDYKINGNKVFISNPM